MSARPAELFAAALVDSGMALTLRATTALDTDFLDDLSMACSPLSRMLPEAMLREQAAFQRIGHDRAYPGAMRRVVASDGCPIGHIAIDWAETHSHCVDIAILPARQGSGVGTALLSAWLAVGRQVDVSATLKVRADSAAVALYRRLGFMPTDEANGPILTMIRVP